MATQLLSVANGAATSSTFTVTPSTPATLVLKGGSANTSPVEIQIQDDAGDWVPVGSLGGSGPTSTIVVGSGVYRVVRPAGVTVGVFYAQS